MNSSAFHMHLREGDGHGKEAVWRLAAGRGSVLEQEAQRLAHGIGHKQTEDGHVGRVVGLRGKGLQRKRDGAVGVQVEVPNQRLHLQHL